MRKQYRLWLDTHSSAFRDSTVGSYHPHSTSEVFLSPEERHKRDGEEREQSSP
jgi:hypothetical protein